jgi:hypothetical protein
MVVTFLFIAVTTGCGRKAPPMPPSIRVAERTNDLKATQEEDTVHLQWSFPQMTSAGGPLPDLEAVALWRMVIPASQEPAPTSARDRKIQVGLLEARGEVIVELEGDGLDLATQGPFLVAGDEIGTIPEPDEGVEEDTVVWYAVRSRCCRHRWSEFSNIVRVIPDDPPPPPSDLTAAANRDGIHLEWPAVEEITVRVERSQDGTTWETIDTVPANTTAWTDPDAEQGVRWSYRLRSVVDRTGGDAVRIGPPGQVVSIEHPDLYPPEPPEDLVCLPEGRRVRLRWRAAAGAQTYRIWRHAGGAPEELVIEATVEVYHVDEAPPAGNVSYTVHGIGEAGNSSEPARCDTVVEENS